MSVDTYQSIVSQVDTQNCVLSVWFEDNSSKNQFNESKTKLIRSGPIKRGFYDYYKGRVTTLTLFKYDFSEIGNIIKTIADEYGYQLDSDLMDHVPCSQWHGYCRYDIKKIDV